MNNFADYIFDIAQNSLKANADQLRIKIVKRKQLTLVIKDNGDGLTEKQLEQAASPFFTTRKRRKVGLGLPLIILLTKQTNGSHHIKSSQKGTKVIFKFDYPHLDFPKEGNYGMLIADLALHQNLKHLTFTYKQKGQHFVWHYNQQSRSKIMRQINQNIIYEEVAYEIFS